MLLSQGNASYAHDPQGQPWHNRHRRLLRESLCFAEQSMAECPVLSVVVVSTTDAAPIESFEEVGAWDRGGLGWEVGAWDRGGLVWVGGGWRGKGRGLP